jgi:hypothetical protein
MHQCPFPANVQQFSFQFLNGYIPHANERMLDVGCWMPAGQAGILDGRYSFFAIRYSLFAVGCWLLAVGCWLLAVGYFE